MTEKLSSSFFGNKKFLLAHYERFCEVKTITDEEVLSIFAPYTHKIHSINSQDGTVTLLPLFAEFIRENLKKFQNWEFQKLSTWIELSAHVFEHSFEQNLSKGKSSEYFSQVLVRHSLFRPPHSVEIFALDECKAITNYWLGSFCRFYDQYKACFEANLNEIIGTTMAGFPMTEVNWGNKKLIERQKFAEKFGKEIDINPIQKLKEEGA